MGDMSLITKIAREDINKGNYLRALVQISADLEFLFLFSFPSSDTLFIE